MVRAAIVGLGWWGRMLVNSVQGKSKDIQFVTAQTRTRAKVEDFCREKNITLVDDVDAILRDPAIDAVVYATPHSQHEEQVERTAAAGKHVFIEKPFALHAASAKKAIAAAEKAGIVLAVGFNRRFHPSMVEMRKRVHDGTLGEIASVIGEQTAMSSPFLPPDGWRADPSETPAGAMTGIGIHTVDTMIHLFGRVTEAYCVTTRRATANIDDTTSVTLRFANGVTGLFFCSLATAGNYRLAVYGSKGFAEISRPTLETFRFQSAPDQPPHIPQKPIPPQEINAPGFDMVAAELNALAASIRDKTPYPVPLDEVLHGVEVFEAIVKSAASGKPVAVG